MVKNLLMAGVVTFASLVGGGAWADTKDALAVTAEKGKVVPAGELFGIYNGRTWMWKDGAGYFSPTKRIFSGWSGSGKDMSYGEGVWFLSDDGLFCFRAKWTSRAGATTKLSCFEHRQVGNTIYARNTTTNGAWYVLTGSGAAYQEAKMLKTGDRVNAKVEDIKKTLETNVAAKT